MRFNELRHGGDRPFVLDLHPRLTLLTGLGDEGRQWLAALIQRAVRGDLEGLAGTVEVHGVERQLSDVLIAELGLPADADVVVRAADLPGARSVLPEGVPEPERAAIETPDEAALPDLRALGNDLAQARHALARASENRAHTAELLDGSRAALAPEAVDVATAEARLDAARRRQVDAAAALQALLQAAPSDDRHRAGAARASLQEQRATLELRRQSIMETLDALVALDVDRSAVAEALSARRQWSPTGPRRVPEAEALADALERVEGALADLGEPPTAPPSLLADAERELAAARDEVASAELALARRQVTPDDAARIEAAHAVALDAEDKAERRLASPVARKRAKDTAAAERAVLASLGFSSYSDYLLNTATLIADPGAPRRLADAHRRLADAEAVWGELTGDALRAEREQLEDRQVELLTAARELLGVLPEADVAGALRALRIGDDDAPERDLLDALRGAGVDIDPVVVADPISAAERFLAGADEHHARRAALQAELSSIADDLDEVNADLAALPPVDDVSDDADLDVDAAREALRVAREEEQLAHRAAVAARSAAGEHRAAMQRIQALEADLAGADAAERQAAAHVARLEGLIADAEAEHERLRKARQVAAERVDAVLDLTAVGRIPTEVYLLARVAAQRDVGQAGSLPIVVDAVDGLPVETTQGVLDLIERFAPVVQFVLMSDDREVEEWASSFGPEGAAVRRFSFVPASS